MCTGEKEEKGINIQTVQLYPANPQFKHMWIVGFCFRFVGYQRSKCEEKVFRFFLFFFGNFKLFYFKSAGNNKSLDFYDVV